MTFSDAVHAGKAGAPFLYWQVELELSKFPSCLLLTWEVRDSLLLMDRRVSSDSLHGLRWLHGRNGLVTSEQCSKSQLSTRPLLTAPQQGCGGMACFFFSLNIHATRSRTILHASLKPLTPIIWMLYILLACYC